MELLVLAVVVYEFRGCGDLKVDMSNAPPDEDELDVVIERPVCDEESNVTGLFGPLTEELLLMDDGLACGVCGEVIVVIGIPEAIVI